MPITKKDAVRVLADAHFRIEDGLERVFIIPAGLNDPREPLKLLEVNANTAPTRQHRTDPVFREQGHPLRHRDRRDQPGRLLET